MISRATYGLIFGDREAEPSPRLIHSGPFFSFRGALIEAGDMLLSNSRIEIVTCTYNESEEGEEDGYREEVLVAVVERRCADLRNPT